MEKRADQVEERISELKYNNLEITGWEKREIRGLKTMKELYENYLLPLARAI